MDELYGAWNPEPLLANIFTTLVAGVGITLLFVAYAYILRTALNLDSGGGEDSQRPSKGSPGYYQERHVWWHSKPKSYDKWDRGNR